MDASLSNSLRHTGDRLLLKHSIPITLEFPPPTLQFLTEGLCSVICVIFNGSFHFLGPDPSLGSQVSFPQPLLTLAVPGDHNLRITANINPFNHRDEVPFMARPTRGHEFSSVTVHTFTSDRVLTTPSIAQKVKRSV